jgi:hypothetical protein
VPLLQFLQHRDQRAPIVPELRDDLSDVILQSLLLPY